MNIRKALPEIAAVLVVVGIMLSLTLAQNSSSNEVTLFDGTMGSCAKLNLEIQVRKIHTTRRFAN